MAYDSGDKLIKKIQVDSTTVPHEIDAKYFDGHKWSEVADLIQVGFEIAVLKELPAADVTSYTTYRNCIVLISDSASLTGSYVEYVILRSGTSGSYTYAWEKIGTTSTDLSGYAKKGTYNTSSTSLSTGSAGGQTVNTSSAGSQTATGTATITYQKSGTATGSANGTTASNTDTANGTVASTTGNAGGVTISGSNFTFEGTAATISVSASYKPAGTISKISHAAHSHSLTTATFNNYTSATTGSTGSHTHSLTTSTFNNYTSATTGSSGGHTHSVAGHTHSSVSVLNSATVSEAGVLSFTSANVGNTGTAATLTAASAGGHTHPITMGGLTTITYVSGTATGSAGDHSHTVTMGGLTTVTYVSGANTGSAGAYTVTPTFTGTTATITLSADYTPEGSIGGSQTVAAHAHSYTGPAPHSHAYTAPAAHTHSISLASTTVTGTASVAVGNHTHSVTVAAHTHSIAAHTHSTTI